jgi:hypothetical protein
VLERWSLVAVRACRLVSPAGKSHRAALSPAFSPLVNTNFLLESLDDPDENRQSQPTSMRFRMCKQLIKKSLPQFFQNCKSPRTISKEDIEHEQGADEIENSMAESRTHNSECPRCFDELNNKSPRHNMQRMHPICASCTRGSELDDRDEPEICQGCE